MHRLHPERRLRAGAAGFTLIEMIVSLTVLGMLAVVMVPLLRMPTVAYLEARGRTELQSQSDLLRGKLEDDLRQALPGSIRRVQVGGVWYLEFLQTRGYGRYRQNNAAPGTCPATPASCTAAGANEFRRQCASETCFTTIGDLHTWVPGSVPVNTDFVVVDPAIAKEDVYRPSPSAYRSRITSYTTPQVSPPVRQVNFLANAFPLAAPSPDSGLFYVVSQAVTYVCDPTAGTLTRRWGYTIQTAQPTAFAGSVASALLSNRITAGTGCWFATHQLKTGPIETGSMLQVRLSLTQVVPGQVSETQPVWLQTAVRLP